MTSPCSNTVSGEVCEWKATAAYIGSLVVLDEAAEGALGGAEGAVEHVRVDLLRVALLLDAAADLECSRLCGRRPGQRVQGRPGVGESHGSRCSC